MSRKLGMKYGWCAGIIYFMLVAIGLSYGNNTLQPLLILIPLLWLLWSAKRWLYLLLGLLVLGWSMLVFIAFLADTIKIQVHDDGSLWFLIVGGSIAVLNLVMSIIWLSYFPLKKYPFIEVPFDYKFGKN